MDIKKINFSNVNFKGGLTSNEINKVRNMSTSDVNKIISNLKRKHGIDAYCAGEKNVAFCLEQTVNIMERAGFKLPKVFLFEPFDKSTLGKYNWGYDAVYINSNNEAFRDLYRQNRMEEKEGIHSPDTKHFLHTYLHEFSHAAHYKNLCDKYGENDANAIFSGVMQEYSPDEVLIGPLNYHLKQKYPKFSKKIIDKIFPPEIGIYSTNSICEYMAEKNSRNLALFLGNNFSIYNIPYNFKNNYKPHPTDWNIINELHKATKSYISNIFNGRNFFSDGMDNISKLLNVVQKEIDYTDGDIWTGNINNIKKSISLHDRN